MKNLKIEEAIRNGEISSYNEYVSDEFLKVDSVFKKHLIINHNRSHYYNPDTMQRSTKLCEVMVPGIDNYEIIKKNDIRNGYYSIKAELSEKKDLLFIEIFELITWNIDTKDNKVTLVHIIAIDKQKNVYAPYSCYFWGNGDNYDKSYKMFFNVRERNYRDVKKINDIIRTTIPQKNLYQYYDNMVFNDLRRAFKYSLNSEKEFSQISRMVSEFLGGNVKTIGSNKIVNIENSYDELVKYLSYKEPISKTSKTVQKYLDIKLPEIDYDKYQDDIFGYADKIDDKMCILRILKHNKVVHKNEDIMKIFITKTNVQIIKKTNNDQWIKVRTDALSNWKFTIYNTNSDALKDTVFDYTKQMLEEIDSIPYALLLQMVLVEPIIEQIYKSELRDILITNLKNSITYHSSVSSFIKCIFGTIDPKQKSLLKKLGFNKYQLKRLAEYSNERLKKADSYLRHYYVSRIYVSTVETIRSLFDETADWHSVQFADVSFLDNDTFDEILSLLEKPLINNHCVQRFVAYTIKTCGVKSAIKYLKENIDTIENANESPFNNYCHSYNYILTDYCDIFLKLKQFNPELVKHYPLHFKANDNGFERICSAHDVLTEIYNTIKVSENERLFQSQIDKIKKWEFESDNFLSIAPSQANDLAVEGMTLHHCVKTYISRVTHGQTNIMFIRKKDDPATPFFTVEISNNGTIEQIHGFANCNVEKDSELEKYVKEWAKSVKLKQNNYNKVR